MLGTALAKFMVYLMQTNQIDPKMLILASRDWSGTSRNKLDQRIHLIHNVDLKQYAKEANVLIHTASPSNITKIESFEKLLDTNTEVLNLINPEVISRVIYISSGEVYGSAAASEADKSSSFDLSNKRNWYPSVKLTGEEMVRKFGPRVGTNVRLFHTFGPGVKEDDGRSFADFLWAAARGNDITLKSKGNQIRSFLYLPDAVNGVFKILQSDVEGDDFYNLGSDKPSTVLEFAEKIAEIAGVSIRFDLTEGFSHSPNTTLLPDTSRLNALGWEMECEESFAIEKTLKWIRNSFQ